MSLSKPTDAPDQEVGEPLTIVGFRDNEVVLYEDNLAKVIKGHEHTKVVVISVAGAYRKGKSFLLCFCHRYMVSNKDANWLGTDNRPLRGFPWRSGTIRQTTGIQIWSKPFPVPLPSGDQVLVLLMDTQGTFDGESSMKECTTVFSLSTLLSSVLVYNVSSNIQANHVQYLQYFIEYGRLMSESGGTKPFQKLLFLVRDWMSPWEKEYGLNGGRQLLDEILATSETQSSSELQALKKCSDCFDSMECYLMPHPGLKIIKKQDFDGRLSDMTKDFQTHINDLVQSLLATENLVVKEIDGNQLTAHDFKDCLRRCVRLYQRSELPEPTSMFQATVELNSRMAINRAILKYNEYMEKECKQIIFEETELKEKHKEATEKAMRKFSAVAKLGNSENRKLFVDNLNSNIDESFRWFEAENKGKALKKNEEIAEESRTIYNDTLNSNIKDEEGVDDSTLERTHKKAKSFAQKHFKKNVKMKSTLEAIEIDTKLESYVAEQFKEIKKRNEEQVKVENEILKTKAFKDIYKQKTKQISAQWQKYSTLPKLRQSMQEATGDALLYFNSNSKMKDCRFTKEIKAKLTEHCNLESQEIEKWIVQQASTLNRKVYSNALLLYETEMKVVIQDGSTCSEDQLESKHENARHKSFNYFTNDVSNLSGDDSLHDDLRKEIKTKYSIIKALIKERIEHRNIRALHESKEQYNNEMENRFRYTTCYGKEEMDKIHQTAMTNAQDTFRNLSVGSNIKQKTILEEYMAHIYDNHLRQNKERVLEHNRKISRETLRRYTHDMEQICSGRILNPDRLENEHDRLKRNSITKCRQTMKMRDSELTTRVLQTLQDNIQQEFQEIRRANELQIETNDNGEAEIAKQIYTNEMEEYCGNDTYIDEDTLNEMHRRAKDKAVQYFTSEKMGSEYDETVERHTSNEFIRFQRQNDAKNQNSVLGAVAYVGANLLLHWFND